MRTNAAQTEPPRPDDNAGRGGTGTDGGAVACAVTGLIGLQRADRRLGSGRTRTPSPVRGPRQPRVAMAWLNVADGRMTAEALDASGR